MNDFSFVLLDIDNTLYDYEPVHKFALGQTILEISQVFCFDTVRVKEAFQASHREIHGILHNSGSSHNRILYFQRLFEKLEIPPFMHATFYADFYWRNFLNHVQLSEGTVAFLSSLNPAKTCFVTDLTAETQLKKVVALGLDKYVHHIVTSEEAGYEKPSAPIFHMALQKLNASPDITCMIGDSYEKDIVGATNLGIFSFWLTRENSSKHFRTESCRRISSLKELA